MQTASRYKIGFLGAGKMATALAQGLVRQRVFPVEAICASDVFANARTAFQKNVGASVFETNEEVCEQSEALVLAVKPQQISTVIESLGSLLDDKLVISIAAGVTLNQLEGQGSARVRMIRVMPNTPALVGTGASVFAPGSKATEQDVELARSLLGAVGIVFRVSEEAMDAVTGLSGSGPAYVYLVIEALADGGVAAGLSRELSLQLAAQTVMGAAKMVIETGQHPGVLKDAVASPGGTTIEGLHALEMHGIRAAFMEAVRVATARSKELSHQPHSGSR